MSRLLRFAAVTLLGLGFSACATTLVSSHVRRDVDFGRYRTFDWGPADALPTGDPRLDADPYFRDYMQGAVERRLAEKGLTLSTTGTSDLLVHYHANVAQRVEVYRNDQGYEDYRTGSGTTLTSYEAGTLVLDIVEAETNRLIWRGWAQDRLDGVIGNRGRMKKMIEQAVAKMLEQLPPEHLTAMPATHH